MSTNFTESECTTPETSRTATPVPCSTRSNSIVSLTPGLEDEICGIPPFLEFTPWYDETCLIKATLDEQVPLRITDSFCAPIYAKYSAFIDMPVIASSVISKLTAICYYLCAAQLYNTMDAKLKNQFQQGKALFDAELSAPRLMIKAVSMLGNFKSPHGKVEVVNIGDLALRWVILGLEIDPNVTETVSSYYRNYENYRYDRSSPIAFSSLFQSGNGRDLSIFDNMVKQSLDDYEKHYQPRLDKIFIMTKNHPLSEGNAAQLVCFKGVQRYKTKLYLTQSEFFLGSLFYPSKSIEISDLDFKSSGDSAFSALKYAYYDVKEGSELA